MIVFFIPLGYSALPFKNVIETIMLRFDVNVLSHHFNKSLDFAFIHFKGDFVL